MKRHTWTASQETHRETRQEFINRFKITLAGQCLEASRGEVLDIRGVIGMLDNELAVRGYVWLAKWEEKEIQNILLGCGFTNNENPFVYLK